jgi:hypothetical protein
MRGDIIFQIFGCDAGRQEDTYFGAFRTREEAEAQIRQLNNQMMNGSNWAAQYHNKGFVIRPAAVATDFEIPPLPKPRDKYAVQFSAKPNRPGTWDSMHVEVFERASAVKERRRICEYERHYAMLQTFEPFRQGNKDFALISRDYTKTAVLDLKSSEVIAEEGHGNSPDGGFCPVGFFVPDWWDVNDGSKLPGSELWTENDEWPKGDFGFVWGCTWGDDSSWKVQYLDLSRVQDGIIKRDDRFGYVELSTADYKTPCLTLDQGHPVPSSTPPFITLSRYDGKVSVTFSVEMAFDLQTGSTNEWKRLKVANFE